MLQILEFIFSSFWVFLGTLILLSVLAEIIKRISKTNFNIIQIGKKENVK